VLKILAAVLFAGAMLAAPAARAAGCDVDRPIVLGGLDYDSAAFDNAIAKLILSKGYGCKVDILPGTVLPLVNGLARGDVDVLMEIWTANPAEAWVKAEREGKVVRLGINFAETREGWFVPRYVVEGPNASAPDLKAVQDLARHKTLFADPEEPAKGRFYNCPAGWQCEVVNSKKLQAYGLTGAFTNFRSGTGEALAAAVEGAVRRHRPILFYYWGPTWLLGKYDFVMLAEPPFDQATWDAMKASDAPSAATAYPSNTVVIGANAEFAKRAPTLAAMFGRWRLTNDIVAEALAHMRTENASAEAAAGRFLKGHPEVWGGWVPQDVAERIKAGL
jgi:glycine betaine/proline transport system substrate-binding protein